MAEIQIINMDDDNLFSYTSEVIPRKGESLTIQGKDTIFKVTGIEHYIRPHGGTGQLISPCIRVVVIPQPDVASDDDDIFDDRGDNCWIHDPDMGDR